MAVLEKLTWRHNALRHSFITSRAAQIQHVAKVSLEAGNSPRMVFSNYRELVRTADAEKWFGITPEAVGAVKAAREKSAAEKIVPGVVPRRISIFFRARLSVPTTADRTGSRLALGGQAWAFSDFRKVWCGNNRIVVPGDPPQTAVDFGDAVAGNLCRANSDCDRFAP